MISFKFSIFLLMTNIFLWVKGRFLTACINMGWPDTFIKGFNVLCFDPKKNLINNLRKKRIHIDEPYLKESIDKIEKKTIKKPVY